MKEQASTTGDNDFNEGTQKHLVLVDRNGSILRANLAARSALEIDETIVDHPVFGALIPELSRGESARLEVSGWAVELDPLDTSTSVIRCTRSARVAAHYFRELLTKLPEVAFLIDRDKSLLWSNTDGVHFPVRESIGLDFLTVVPETKRAIAEKAFRRVLETGESVHLDPEHFELAGIDTYYESRWIPVFDGELVRYVGLFARDTTDRMKSELELVKSQARYRQLIDNSLDLIAIFTGDYKLQFVTPNVEAIVGYTPAQLRRIQLFDHISPDDVVTVRSTIEALLEAPHTPQSTEIDVLHKDGHVVTLETRARAVGDGEPAIIVNARDVSARKESEALRDKLIRADKLAAIGQLAAGVAHEINNPSAYICTNLFVLQELVRELAQVHDDFKERLHERSPDYATEFQHVLAQTGIADLIDDIEAIVRTNLTGMDRITRIVRDLRTFSRDEPPRVEPVDVNSAVTTALNMVRSRIDYVARLELELGESLPAVAAEHTRISQVVVNLLVNASQAISEDSTNDDPFVRVSTTSMEDHVAITIEDNGTGIAPDIESRLFEPFFSTKVADFGTGLGLWLSSQIVESFGGRLTYSTRIGEGTCFEVSLPCRHGTDRPVKQPGRVLQQTPPMGTGAPKRILLIDDDELVLDSYRRMLGESHDICLACGGKRALEILDGSHDFDLIICDLDMPGIDGIRIHQYLQRRAPELLERCVFCTSGIHTRRTRSFTEKCARCLEKPISSNRMNELLSDSTLCR